MMSYEKYFFLPVAVALNFFLCPYFQKAGFVQRNYKVLFIRILFVHLFKIAKKVYYEKRISTQTNHVALLFPVL